MAVSVKITNSEFSGQSEVMNNLKFNKENDTCIELDRVKIDENSKVLNSMSEVEAGKILCELERQKRMMEETETDYQKLEAMFLELKNSRLSGREVLKKYLPGLVTGTLANVINSLLFR